MSALRIVLRLALGILALGGCRGGTSTEPPIVPFRGMHEMPRYDPQEASRYFEDGRSMRPPVDGTVPMEADSDPSVEDGLDERGEYVLTIPASVVERLGGMEGALERGRERFHIYCGPCHGDAGDGRGMVRRRADAIGGSFAAADLTSADFRHISDGRLYLTITNGVRTMPAYRAQVPTDDRWAIVAWVRALQLHAADARAATADADGDGVQAWADRCLDLAEDPDGFADADGCPEDDNDGDGVADGVDACPTAPGATGCPEHVRVGANGLTLLRPIRFARGTNELAGRSAEILAEVRAVLEANPALRVRVEAHVDDRGDPDANRTLTEHRAQAVIDWLVDHGIAAVRLEARGLGSSRAIGDNATPAGRAANRRVEFNFVAP